jgi:hypothetical protein
MIAAWNVLGFALLINIVVVAILSTPTFAFFGRPAQHVRHRCAVRLVAGSDGLGRTAGHLIIARAVTR